MNLLEIRDKALNDSWIVTQDGKRLYALTSEQIYALVVQAYEFGRKIEGEAVLEHLKKAEAIIQDGGSWQDARNFILFEYVS